MLAIYTRLSREKEESNSIYNQLREGKEFAKLKNFSVYEIYNEGEGVSGGAKIKNRPQLSKLINDIENKFITAIWFRDQDRLERSGLTFWSFAEAVNDNYIDVYFGNELVDFSNPDNLLQRGMQSLMNQNTRLKQSKKTKKTLHDNLKEGKTRGGIMSYGYATDKDRIVIIDEIEAEIIKRIYKLSLEGIGTNKIAEILNKEAVPTRYNKMKGVLTTKDKYSKEEKTRNKKDIKWAGNTILNIIKSETYKGVKYLGKGKEKRQYPYPIIIEPNNWQKVNDNLKKNTNNSGRRVEHKYLLKGLIRCSKCGRNYYGRRRADKSDNFYGCLSKRYKENCGNRGINIDALENFIWQRFFLDKRLKKITLKHFENNDFKLKSEVLVKEVDNLKEKLKSLSEQRKKATKLIVQGLFSDKDFEREINRIESEKSDTDIRIKNYLEDLDSYNKSVEKEKEIDKDLKSLKDFSFNQKGSLIKKYINKIEVDFINNFYQLEISFNIIDMESEKYVIDRNYNLAYDKLFIYNGRAIILSDKLKKLNEEQITQKILEFEEKYNPTQELLNEIFLAEVNTKEFQDFYNGTKHLL